MDRNERYDEYFLYSYYDEDGKKIGVFRKGTPKDIIAEAEKMFDVIEFLWYIIQKYVKGETLWKNIRI